MTTAPQRSIAAETGQDPALVYAISPLELTDAQRDFADAHHATPGFRSELSDAVFVYRRGGRRTTRWLVDASGLIVGSTSFRTAAAPHDGA
jgi:hypothetical protein